MIWAVAAVAAIWAFLAERRARQWRELSKAATRAQLIAEAAEKAAWARVSLSSDALSSAQLQIQEWRNKWARAAASNAELTRQLLGRVN